VVLILFKKLVVYNGWNEEVSTTPAMFQLQLLYHVEQQSHSPALSTNIANSPLFIMTVLQAKKSIEAN